MKTSTRTHELTPIDVLDHNILTLCSRINAATYELLVMIREFASVPCRVTNYGLCA